MCCVEMCHCDFQIEYVDIKYFDILSQLLIQLKFRWCVMDYVFISSDEIKKCKNGY